MSLRMVSCSGFLQQLLTFHYLKWGCRSLVKDYAKVNKAVCVSSVTSFVIH